MDQAYNILETPQNSRERERHSSPQRPAISQQEYERKQVYHGFGVAEIILGIISILLGITGDGLASYLIRIYLDTQSEDFDPWVYYPYTIMSLTYASAGVWCGLFLVATGIVGVRLKRVKTSSEIWHHVHVTMAFIAPFIMAIQMVISAVGIYFTRWSNNGILFPHMLAFVVGFVSFVTSIVHSALTCNGFCCCSGGHDAILTKNSWIAGQQSAQNDCQTAPSNNSDEITSSTAVDIAMLENVRAPGVSPVDRGMLVGIPVKSRFNNVFFCLGISEIIIGVVSCVVTIASNVLAGEYTKRFYAGEFAERYYHYESYSFHYPSYGMGMAFASPGIWCSVFLIASGIISIRLRKKKPSNWLEKNRTVLNIITCIMMGAQIVICSSSAALGYDVIPVIATQGTLASIALIGMIVSIVQSVYCCAASEEIIPYQGQVRYIVLPSQEHQLTEVQPIVTQGSSFTATMASHSQNVGEALEIPSDETLMAFPNEQRQHPDVERGITNMGYEANEI